MPTSKKSAPPKRSSNEARDILLRYFHARNSNATSARGKRGFAVKIMDVRKNSKPAMN